MLCFASALGSFLLLSGFFGRAPVPSAAGPRSTIACGVWPEEDPDPAALRALRLCVEPREAYGLGRLWIAWRSRLPDGDLGAKVAFVAFRKADRLSCLVVDPWDVVLLFHDVYRDLVERLPAAGLPSFKAGHIPGAALVLEHKRRVVFDDHLRRVSHRHALRAAAWQQEMRSWRARDRCGRHRGDRCDLRKLLDRRLTPFRLFALHGAYTLCPKCGLRNFARPFAWPVEESLKDPEAFVRLLPEKGALMSCRMHGGAKIYEYAVPDLLAESAIAGTSRRRWTYWPRFNEQRGVFEELVTDCNREWPNSNT